MTKIAESPIHLMRILLFMWRSGALRHKLKFDTGEIMVVTKQFAKIGVLALTLWAAAPALAGSVPASSVDSMVATGEFRIAEGEDLNNDGSGAGASADVAIAPREAAAIAKSAFPGARVLKVKLLPSGVYAVTLRGDGKLTRVMVDGQSGNIM